MTCHQHDPHLPIRHDRGRGIPLCFWGKGMRGKGRGLEVRTLAYPCTLTKGIGVCLHKNIVQNFQLQRFIFKIFINYI